jgi:hypothetical protein
MVTSCSFLLTGLLHRQGEVAKTQARLPTQDGIRSERGKMVGRKPDSPPCVHFEAAHRSGYTTGQPQLAGGIQEQQNAFAEAIALTAGPKASPLQDREIFSFPDAANRALNVKGDGDCGERLRLIRGTALNPGDGTGKNRS